MNFSYEELYFNFGQFDTFVTLTFDYNSDEFKRFGTTLMGEFLYTQKEREELEQLKGQELVNRSDKKVKFRPSELEKISEDELISLDKDGIQASSINVVSYFDRQKENRFIKKEKKNIENEILIKAPSFSGWEELNRVRFGFLNTLYKEGTKFTPKQQAEYWAFRNHYKVELQNDDYKDFFKNGNKDILDEIRVIELEVKLQELNITEEEMQEFAKLLVAKRFKKKDVIDSEIQKSHEKITEVAKNYHTELTELKKACYKFDEEIIALGKTPVYLGFERFVHIYARHVSETQIGDRFSGKTVFQYKYEDILRILKLVVQQERDEIQKNLQETPPKSFLRMGSRAIYFDGNYYRLEIESDGNIKDFHPYNNSEERDNDN